MDKDTRVNLKILSDRLREVPKWSQDELESLISEKTSDSDSESTTETYFTENSSIQPIFYETILILSHAYRKSHKSQLALLSDPLAWFGDADQKKPLF